MSGRKLRQQLDAFEERLSATRGETPDLDGLGGPAELDLLFRVHATDLLRRGPRDGAGAPGRLLDAAVGAAVRGLLPVATCVALRELFVDAEESLHASGAWDRSTRAWFAPLPPQGALEEHWRRCEERAVPLRRVRLDRGWATLPLLPDDDAGEISRLLEDAFRDGRLELERAGVGAQGRVSARRADGVLYTDGTDLLDVSPALAVLVQWLLARLPAVLGRRHLAPPQRAMLARYPAPSTGYAPHLDNPGGEDDNGRAVTFLLYLATPDEGGELVLWEPGSEASSPPAEVVPAVRGRAAVFDARTVPHQVRPLGKGAARWSLAVWLQDGPVPLTPRLPRPTASELLLPITDPPLPAETILVHELTAGVLEAWNVPPRTSRAGVVATVYRGGTFLDTWCAHHLAVGFDHLYLVFDHFEDASEQADAQRLRERHPEERLTILAGGELARDWPEDGELRHLARRGGAAWAVAARQTLHASAVLGQARAAGLDWLLHLDGDELFHLEGRGRGGETAGEHFAAAGAQGIAQLRYLNHERLDGNTFKVNPRLAAARLGPAGWEAVRRRLDRPELFNAYQNGKAAVAVRAAAAAAGVHGWRVQEPRTEPGRTALVAGPSILHLHFPSAAAFRRKYTAMADAEDTEQRPFEPSPAEAEAVALIRRLRRAGAPAATVRDELDALYRRLVDFSDADVALLEAAGLLFSAVPRNS